MQEQQWFIFMRVTQRMVNQRLETLRQRQLEVTKRLAEKYQASLENRVEAYIDTFEKLQTVRPVQSALALQELVILEARLVESGAQLETGNVANAIRELQSTERRLKRLSNSLNGGTTNKLLQRIDELTATLEASTDTSEARNEIENTKKDLQDYLSEAEPTGTTNVVPTGPNDKSQ